MKKLLVGTTLKNCRILTLVSFLLANSMFAQIESIGDILKRAIHSCNSISSISYSVEEEPVKSKNGFATIVATVVQKKSDNVKDVGFDNSMIVVNGSITEKGEKQKFSYAYNGNQFAFKKGNNKLKLINNPSRKTTMGYLQQFLFMLRVFPFSEAEPYKSQWGDYILEGQEEVDNHLCYKISSSASYKMPNGNVAKPQHVWWIGTEDYLPRAYSDGVMQKYIKVEDINFSISDSYFSLNESTYEKLSNTQAQAQVDEKFLLSHNIEVPQWKATSQKGINYSRDVLIGKVVFIDFWATWCMPCTNAMPEIEKLYQIFKNNDDVVILGVSSKEKNKNHPIDYFESKGFNYIHIPNGDDIAKSFKVKIYPTIYIIDKEGKIVFGDTGNNPKDYDKWKATIKELLIKK